MRKSIGFTLIEVLVSIAIFSLIGIGCYNILFGMVNARSSINQKTEKLKIFSRAIHIINDDLTQLSSRKIVDENDEVLPPLIFSKSENSLEFSRHGIRNPRMEKRSEVSRVVYQLVNKDDLDIKNINDKQYLESDKSVTDDNQYYLVRKTWPVLDRVSDIEDLPVKVIFDDVTEFNVNFYNDKSKWIDQWPQKKGDDFLPHAIKIKIVTSSYGTIEKIISISNPPT